MRGKDNVGLQITINKKLLEIMDQAISEINKSHPDEAKITRSQLIHDCLIIVLLGGSKQSTNSKKEA